MIEEHSENIEIEKNEETSITKTVDDYTKEVVDKITEVDNTDDYKRLVDLFNLNQSKKNALRVLKLNGLLDKVEDQVIERFSKRPDQISNQELLEFLKTIENSIERSQKTVNNIEDKPMIQINSQTNNINVENVEGIKLDKQSKQKVLDLVSNLLKNASLNNTTDQSDNYSEVIEVDMTENENKEGENK